jgi:uncharacterized protein (TIGR03382 family)
VASVCDSILQKCVECLPPPGEDSTPCVENPEGGRCLTDDQGYGVCGCAQDTDCGGIDSGRICEPAPGRCVDGCSPAPGRNGCPADLFCSSADPDLVGVCGPFCVGDVQCEQAAPATPVCDEEAGACVECGEDADCGAPTPVCSAAHTCVECAPNRGGCSPGGSGSACLPDGTCGCDSDDDCEVAAGGRVCDPVSRSCEPGCREASGVGCGEGLVCSTTGEEAGECVVPEPAAGLKIAGGGIDLGCSTAGGAASPLLAGLLLAMGLVRRRRRLGR